jgi:hypothetical protein
MRVGIPFEEFWDEEAETDEILPGWEVQVTECLSQPGSKIYYEYDFGDSWEHEIELEAVLPADPGTRYPVCLSGRRCCPPEDCGGTPGYEQFLDAIRDPQHPEHEDMLQWVGGPFDPEEFDAGAVRFTDPRKRLRSLLSG